MPANNLLSYRNPVFNGFAFYVIVVLVKMLVMSILTARQRFAKKAFANPEDGGRKNVNLGDPDVERVRRGHMNDMENIIPFVLIGILFVLTNPSLGVAMWHFRIFAGARILHTICYLTPVAQPSRVLCFLGGYFTTFSMAFFVIKAVTLA